MTTLKVGRGWSNKLDRIDSLIGWMYDEDILNMTEKKKKDTVFYSYYRYYNDGDIPGGLGRYNAARGIEERLNKFISHILTKYKGKYSRQDFYAAQQAKAYNNTNAARTGSNRVPDLLNEYYAKAYIEKYSVKGAKKLINKVEALRKQLAEAEAEVGAVITAHSESK